MLEENIKIDISQRIMGRLKLVNGDHEIERGPSLVAVAQRDFVSAQRFLVAMNYRKVSPSALNK